jgi:hypothetical protein
MWWNGMKGDWRRTGGKRSRDPIFWDKKTA